MAVYPSIDCRRTRLRAACLCGMLALCAAAAKPAEGAWIAIDTFEGMALNSALNGQNGWTAPEAGVATRRVVADPAGGSNQVLSVFETATGTLNLYKQATLPAGNTGTLFFRFRFGAYDETTVNGPSVGIGMDDTTAPTSSPNNAGPFIVPDGNSGLNEITIDTDTSSASNFVPLESLAEETWYSAWMVIDNANALFSLWVQGGSLGLPTLLDDPTGDTTLKYRQPSFGDLLSVWIRPNNEHGDAPGQTMYFDDFYLDAAAQNLADPTAVPEPGAAISAALALVGFGLLRRRARGSRLRHSGKRQ